MCRCIRLVGLKLGFRIMVSIYILLLRRSAHLQSADPHINCDQGDRKTSLLLPLDAKNNSYVTAKQSVSFVGQ